MRLLTIVLLAALLGTGVAAGEAKQESPPLHTDTVLAAHAAREAGGEVFPMRWKMTGFLGAIASLFVPTSGDALLTFVGDSDSEVDIKLLITAPKREGEFFLYGAEIDGESGFTSSVRSDYTFRGKSKHREQTLETPNVIDYASAIYHLRWHPPKEVTALQVWSNGKLYPAEIKPLPKETRKIGDEKIEVRGYEVRGLKVKGESSFDETLTFYFALDERSSPVEFVGKRGWTRVRLRLVDD